MGIVSQESIMFNDSVINNITLGNTKLIWTMSFMQQKQLMPRFYNGDERGYNSNIGEGGINYLVDKNND